jgi:hypothetical protein
MRSFAFEITDRSIVLAQEGKILARAGDISLEESGLKFFQASWGGLCQQHGIGGENPVAVAIPEFLPLEQLSFILGASKKLPLRISNFVDSSVVSAAILRQTDNALFIELGRRQGSVTAVERAGNVIRRRAGRQLARVGWQTLRESWLALASAAMVKRNRFDPLHHVNTEAQLLQQIDAALPNLKEHGEVLLKLEHHGEQFELGLARDQFIAAVESSYQNIFNALDELQVPHKPLAVVVTDELAQSPGFIEACQKMGKWQLLSATSGFAAAALSLRGETLQVDSQSARLLRRLSDSPDIQSRLPVTAYADQRRLQSSTNPTHLLFENRAYPLQSRVIVGRASSPFVTLTLPEGLAGISRRHCTIIRQADDKVSIIDHSQFGTYLNDQKIQARAQACSGDQLRIGDPGVTLTFIAA